MFEADYRALLTDQDVADLSNALDVLCGCYGKAESSVEVQELFKRYGPGTKDGIRARRLFRKIRVLSRIPLSCVDHPTCRSSHSCNQIPPLRLVGERKPRGKLSKRARWQTLERAGFRCQACGARAHDGAKLHVDHIHPLSKGGTNDISNLQCLCQACNLGKADRLMRPPVQDSIEQELEAGRQEVLLWERNQVVWERFLRVYGNHYPAYAKIMKDHAAIVQLANHEVVLDVRPKWGPMVKSRLHLIRPAFEEVLGGSVSVLFQGD